MCSSEKKEKKKTQKQGSRATQAGLQCDLGRTQPRLRATQAGSHCDLRSATQVGARLGRSGLGLHFFFFFFIFFFPELFLFLRFGWLIIYFLVGNWVSKTWFPCKYHMKKCHIRRTTHRNRVSKTRFMDLNRVS